jgi:DNA topoisomerase IB
MDRTTMRVGSKRYAERLPKDVVLPSGKSERRMPTRGGSSLEKDDVTVRGDEITVHFNGKSGLYWEPTFRDRDLANTVRLFKTLPGKRLFQVPLGDRLRPVTERSLRRLFARYGATPKDLRTAQANQLLDDALAARPRPTTLAQAQRQLKESIFEVATQMGHTIRPPRSTTISNRSAWPPTPKAFASSRAAKRRSMMDA